MPRRYSFNEPRDHLPEEISDFGSDAEISFYYYDDIESEPSSPYFDFEEPLSGSGLSSPRIDYRVSVSEADVNTPSLTYFRHRLARGLDDVDLRLI